MRSSLDSDRFGIEVYRADIDDTESLARSEILAREAGAALVIARVSADRMDLVQGLERTGAQLCDTLVYWGCPSSRFQAGPDPATPADIQLAKESDRAALQGLARAAFSDFAGHYHSDTNLRPEDATEGYVEWCVSLLGAPNAFVLIASLASRPAGFLAAVLHPDSHGEIVLNGVAPHAQRRGVYGALVDRAAEELIARGANSIFTSTQLANVGPQKTWARRGLEPQRAVYTFHRWPSR